MAEDPEVCGLSDEALQEHLRRGTFATPLEACRSKEARPLLRLLWASFLGITSGSGGGGCDVDAWVEELQQQRRGYAELKERHGRENDTRQKDPNVCNPLSKSADNPFVKLKANEELLQEIWKDVERTYPEMEIFQQEVSQRCIQQVLYHWCKACNPAADASESYRQGMNELAALCFFVVRLGEYAGRQALGAELCGREHNEADTFILFGALLERGGLRDMFAIVRAKPVAKAAAVKDVGSLPGVMPARKAPPARPQSALLARCKHIFHGILKHVDPELHAFLERKGVEPQIFLLRWLRLLFCREFHIVDTTYLWTQFLADAASPVEESSSVPYAPAHGNDREGARAAEAASEALPLVDYFAVAMIEFLREELLGLDESGCLQRLMKFPPVENISALVTLARQLRAGKRVAATGPPAAPAQNAEAPHPLVPKPGQNPRSPPVATATSPPAGAASQQDSLQQQQQQPGLRGVPVDPQRLVKGLFEVGRQAVEGITSLAQQPTSAASACPEPFTPAAALRIAELQGRVRALEEEKAALVAKAKQFVASKTQELRNRVAELEAQLQNNTGNSSKESQDAAVADQVAGPFSDEASELRASLVQSTRTEAELQASLAVAEQQLVVQEAELDTLRNEKMRTCAEMEAMSQKVRELEARLAAADFLPADPAGREESDGKQRSGEEQEVEELL